MHGLVRVRRHRVRWPRDAPWFIEAVRDLASANPHLGREIQVVGPDSTGLDRLASDELLPSLPILCEASGGKG
jgi:hypothetical protein